jgi:hypothetical protein
MMNFNLFVFDFDAEYFGAQSKNQTFRQFSSVGGNQED